MVKWNIIGTFCLGILMFLIHSTTVSFTLLHQKIFLIFILTYLRITKLSKNLQICFLATGWRQSADVKVYLNSSCGVSDQNCVHSNGQRQNTSRKMSHCQVVSKAHPIYWSSESFHCIGRVMIVSGISQNMGCQSPGKRELPTEI